MKHALFASETLVALPLIAYLTVVASGQSISTPNFWKRSGSNIHNTNDGNVGIGTNTANTPLDVRGIATNQILTMQAQDLPDAFAVFKAQGQPNIFIGGDDGTFAVRFGGNPNNALTATGSGNQNLSVRSLDNVSCFSRFTNQNGSNVFVGNNDGAMVVRVGTSANLLTVLGDGKVGIGTDTPATTLDVDGAVTIRGGADIVEGFDACEVLDPGTVVVIDPENPGCLKASRAAYDRKVAGVVSGAGGVSPGVHLGQDGVLDGPTKVALSGRVYVKASAANGAIRAGDRLTSSSLAGHAMRATDAGLSNGAVLGKAMSELESGTGLVLVLVTLQ